MAFTLRKITGATNSAVTNALRNAIEKSRFVVDVQTQPYGASLHKIRLRSSKDYCGNHPYACPVRIVHTPHRHSTCLEGADWVAFNDMLNDVLDELNACANVASSLCIIRKGALRRTEYRGHKLGNGIDSEWNKDTEATNYQDKRGFKSIRSKFPQDTPGEPEWLAVVPPIVPITPTFPGVMVICA